MNIDDLKNVLIAFADSESDLDMAGGELVVQIRDQIIQVSVEQQQGNLFITENGERNSAYSWLINRVARIPQLADRLLDNVPFEPHFISPSGMLIDQIDANPEDREKKVEDVANQIPDLLSRRAVGTSTVLYLTSDAGEGKTTLINWIARNQAQLYKDQQTDWLLIPISLGGRSFLTFDDIVVAELVNRLRFQFFYYNAFLELVKMGVLVPAFDGFEEMFVEGSSGEALSALGNLMNSLDSSGTALIAARKAYFEYRNFATQARLFDAIRDRSVSFANIKLNRWDRKRFLSYAERRNLSDRKTIYHKVRTRLKPDHPLLTRAVLVKRLVEEAQDGNVDTLLDRLGTTPEDYFFQFVNTLVERESREKWIDRSGTPHQSLLTTEEHHALLALVAKEMWISSSEVLKGDYLDLIGELFASEIGKPTVILRQIVNRIRQHSLIVSENEESYAFDHEDFRKFYLGEALGTTLLANDDRDIIGFLEKGSLPQQTCDAALNMVKRNAGDLGKVLRILQSLVNSSAPPSYVVENAASIVIRLLELLTVDKEVVVKEFTFASDALKDRRFGEVKFEGCLFQETSLENTHISRCQFRRCTIYRLEIPSDFRTEDTIIEDTEILGITRPGELRGIYDPESICEELTSVGFEVKSIENRVTVQQPVSEADEDTLLAERALRAFMRATQINEGVFRQKFGKDANRFMEKILPKMIGKEILQEVPYRGGGAQRRFGICVPMSNIEAAVPTTLGSLDEFLSSVKYGA